MKNEKSYPKKNAYRQLVWLFLFFLIVIFIIIYIEHSVNQSMEEEQLITLETVSEKVTSNIREYFEQQWGHLDYIEETMRFDTYDTQQEIFQMMERVKNAHGLGDMDSRLILIDERGYYYTCEGEKIALWSGLNNLVSILPEDKMLALSSLSELEGHLEQYICFMKKMKEPIVAADGSSFPYLVLATDDHIFNIDLSMGEFGTVTDAFIVKKNGRKVNAQMERVAISKSYNILSALKNATFILGDSYEQMVEGIKQEKSGSSLIHYAGEEYFVSHHFLNVEDWNVLFIVQREQMIDRITPFVYRLIVVLAISFTILFLLIFNIIHSNKKEELERERIINEQLKISAQIAEQANKTKSEFLSRMSHDIRTPLNGIIGMTAIAEKTLEDKDSVKSCLKKITSASNHLLELINEVLEFSRVENGKVEVKNAPLDLHELFTQISDMNESRIIMKNITYQTDTSRLHYPYIFADRTILNQILLNIIGNAVKYTENDGKIQCTVYDKYINEKQAEYHFIISDTGIGMTPEYVEHIFEKFSQEEIGARTNYEGTGLGMAITKQLLDMMGGTIQVQSEKNVGSTFEVCVCFPICEKQDVYAEEEVEQKESREPIPQQSYHILLVEDNEMNREIAQFLLEDAGLSCEVAEDGIQAVELFAQSELNRYDCILMDILMPNMDGHEATKKIRAMERADAKTIPIFAMTAGAYQEDRKKSLDAGMNAHLTKPIVLDEVLEQLQQWCSEEQEH